MTEGPTSRRNMLLWVLAIGAVATASGAAWFQRGRKAPTVLPAKESQFGKQQPCEEGRSQSPTAPGRLPQSDNEVHLGQNKPKQSK